ncbi:DUF2125 domain-containing protein [Glycocaulis abyssi]|uniref:DUF2125 domain-containing protein n=1 Tax=Glycocaulis abyssi TaxID=1433403 RepID=A0ABV9NF74_9PROT
MIRDFSTPEPARRSRLSLILPFAAFGILLAAYGGYWLWMSGEIRKTADSWVEERESEGYVISLDQLSVSGFPFRFTVTARAPEIIAPPEDGGWRMAMPQLSASALPYNISHWIVAFASPAELDLQGDEDTSALLATASRARISLASGRAGTVRAGAELEEFRLIARESGEVLVEALDQLVLSSELVEDDQMRIRLEVRGLELGPDQLDERTVSAFGRRIELMRTDTTLSHWSALAADANLASWSDSGGRAEIAMAALHWGHARLSGEGTMGVDALLRPEGRLSVLVAEPESLVAALVAGGVASPSDGEALRLALMMAPRRDEGVALPFRFQQGGIFLGPVRIGEAGPLTGQLPIMPELPDAEDASE